MLSVLQLVGKDLRDLGEAPETSASVSPMPFVLSSHWHSLVLLRPRGAVVGTRHLHQGRCEALQRGRVSIMVSLVYIIRELKTRLTGPYYSLLVTSVLKIQKLDFLKNHITDVYKVKEKA